MNATSAAYYNEHDRFCAGWLRNLISAGLIAPGYVDERDVRDVVPSDLAGYRQVHLFAGIGLWSHALRLAGWSDDRAVWSCSCPCQPFSQAGRGDGIFDDRHLWPAAHWLIAQLRPEQIVGEQVAGADGAAWLDIVSSDLEALSYTCQAVAFCSAGVGAPNIRQRLFWLANACGGRTWGHAGSSDRTQANSDGTRFPERGTGGDASVSRGAVGGLANAKCDGEAQQPGRERQAVGISPEERTHLGADVSGRSGQTSSRLADIESIGRHGSIGSSDGTRSGTGSPHSSRLVDTESRGCGIDGLFSGEARGRQDPGQPPLADQVVGQRLGHTERARLQDTSAPLLSGAGRRSERGKSQPPSGAPSSWRDPEWVYCRDGKYRPFEPGSQPMADGYSASVASPRSFPLAPRQAGDVAKLRAYGNAINPVAAAAVIRAWMECQPS